MRSRFVLIGYTRPAAGIPWSRGIDCHLDQVVAVHHSGKFDDDDGRAQKCKPTDDSVAFFHGPLPPTSRESRTVRGAQEYIAFCAKRYGACSCCESPGRDEQQAACDALDPSAAAIVETSARA